MAASYFGDEVKETQRHKLGKLLGSRTRNFFLMSATPHKSWSRGTTGSYSVQAAFLRLL
jgi:hypothetical protein